jgi:hypothetical protein
VNLDYFGDVGKFRNPKKKPLRTKSRNREQRFNVGNALAKFTYYKTMGLNKRITYYRWKWSSTRFDFLGFQFSPEELSASKDD